MSKLIVETGLILGILVIAILFFFQKKNKNINNYFLILSLTCIWLALFINNLNETGKILEYPFFIRTGNIPAYLIFPFLYLYTRNTFYPGRFWQKKDFILLLPALFYVVDMLPFFFSSTTFKIEITKANLSSRDRMSQIAEGWIAIKGFHFVFRYLWSVIITAMQVRVIYRNRNFKLTQEETNNRSLFWFIMTLTLLHLPLIIPGIFGAILHLSWFTILYMNFSLAIVLIATTVFILFSPHILYGFLPLPIIPEIKSVKKDFDRHSVQSEPAQMQEIPRLRIPESEMNAMLQKIEDFMHTSRPYTNQHYTIHDLSTELNIPVYQLSPIINNYYQTNFNSWLNKFRVDYFIEISQGDAKKGLTLDAIAKEAGFTNRTTFTNAFKKEKGTTPGQFVKTHQNSY